MFNERKECLNTHFPYGLAVRISGFRPGSTPGMGRQAPLGAVVA